MIKEKLKRTIAAYIAEEDSERKFQPITLRYVKDEISFSERKFYVNSQLGQMKPKTQSKRKSWKKGPLPYNHRENRSTRRWCRFRKVHKAYTKDKSKTISSLLKDEFQCDANWNHL